jgi:hypothetical protein
MVRPSLHSIVPRGLLVTFVDYAVDALDLVNDAGGDAAEKGNVNG